MDTKEKRMLGRKFIEDQAESNENVKRNIINVFDNHRKITKSRVEIQNAILELSEIWGTTFLHTRRALMMYLKEHSYNWA